MQPLRTISLLLLAFAGAALAAGQTLVVEAKRGSGSGKRVVLVSGDEEYRSEQMLPQLARILAERHGFHATVLFAIDPTDGTINPNRNDNIPGLEALDRADLMILMTRFRNLPDDQMKHIADYVESGRPIIGLRTATHAFKQDSSPAYRRYAWNNKDKEWEGGFGRQVLGETWVAHHGRHAVESTRGVIVKGMENHPILRGVSGIWVPSDVYTVRLPLPGDCQPLVLGEVLEGMQPGDKPVAGKKNDPLLPVAWVKTYTGKSGKAARVFTTTMGSAQDLENEGLRRLLVNGVYWATGIEERITATSDVGLVGDYKPLPFRFNGFAKGLKVADLAAK